MDKKILVISYNAFSKEGANGRTLEFLVSGFAPDNVGQIYFSAEHPDFSVCNSFWQIEEKALLKAFIKMKKAGCEVKRDCVQASPEMEEKINKIAEKAKKNKRSSFVKFLRGVLWTLGRRRWDNVEFRKWVKEFSPEVVLTMSGKNACFHNIARKIAKRLGVPLAVYHCEDYCFKNTNPHSLGYRAYIRGLKRSVDRLMRCASLAIYNSDALRYLYEKHYNTPSVVAYMSTSVIAREKREMPEEPVFSYMGNLSLGRDVAIAAVAEVLAEVNSRARIDIYTQTLPDGFAERIAQTGNLNYCGFINYDKCREVMAKSDVILHAESFDEMTKKDLRIAFSTKIADSLASGVPFFVYAPRGIASVEYLLECGGAVVATDKSELFDKLSLILTSSEERDARIKRALMATRKNHTYEKTSYELKEKLCSIKKAFKD